MVQHKPIKVLKKKNTKHKTISKNQKTKNKTKTKQNKTKQNKTKTKTKQRSLRLLYSETDKQTDRQTNK